MNTRDRINRIVLDACDVRIACLPPESSRIEVDTSSSRVPFGFVDASIAVLVPGEAPDSFWSSCLGADSHVNIYSARLQVEENPKVDGIFSEIRSDLRSADAQGLIELPALIRECFALHHCCESCCGSVLLIRTENQGIYIHWHRES